MNSRNALSVFDKFSAYMQTLNGLTATARAANANDSTIYKLLDLEDSNPLCVPGDLNVQISSHECGFVEVGHLAILHGALDMYIGWTAEQ